MKLAPREREAIQHVMQGRTVAETARRMGVSPYTAKTYLLRARVRNDCATLVQLCGKFAIEGAQDAANGDGAPE